MTDTREAKGHCLCGAVKIEVPTISNSLGACHCDMCQRWTGGPWLTLDCGSDVVFEGEESIGTYDSSEWAARGFCKQCGTNLYYKVKASNQYFMPAGVFENLGKIIFDHQIFIDEKPAYYDFANDTKNMTGAEVFAKFAPQ